MPNATEIEAAKVLAATQKEQDLAIEKGLAREKAAAESKARADEEVARAADLGDRRRKAEAEAAAIRSMMAAPAKKAPPPPRSRKNRRPPRAQGRHKGTLHAPARETGQAGGDPRLRVLRRWCRQGSQIGQALQQLGRRPRQEKSHSHPRRLQRRCGSRQLARWSEGPSWQ